MIYYIIFGIDKNGLAYTFANETISWTLRGVRRETQCFGLCEVRAWDGELDYTVTYSWNPVDGYVF
jgi:hypothetical protein